jgi:hypothetical protein
MFVVAGSLNVNTDKLAIQDHRTVCEDSLTMSLRVPAIRSGRAVLDDGGLEEPGLAVDNP